MTLRKCAIAITLALSAASLHASVPELPVGDFFKDAEFSSASLSPDGTYLAVSVPQGDRTQLAILKTADLSLQSKFDYGENKHIEGAIWVSDRRFLMPVFEQTGRFDFRTADSLHASDVDGKRRLEIPNGFAYGLVSTLPEDDRNVLAARSRENAFLYRIDTVTGEADVVATSPLDTGTFVVDRGGNVRYTFGENDDLTSQSFRRVGSEWELIHTAKYAENGSRTPIGISGDGKRVIMEISDAGEPARVSAIDPDTGEEEVLARNPRVEPLGIGRSADGSEVLAVGFMDGRPELTWVNADHPDTKLMAGLTQAFPNHAVSFQGMSEDGNKVLVYAYSDVDPGTYYLYNRETGQAKFLLSSMSWIKPDQMSEMRPITVKARDGVELHGYITIPRGSDGKNLPMILHPHGGPHGPRDMWGFNPEVQFLANRGYAVMQINFRGSGGYGKAFEAKGYQNWGTTMIDDMTDAMAWAVQQGIADPNRLCTYGASYGGYAALQSVVREPTKYRCAIGYVGLYNMDLWKKDSDVADRRSGRNYQAAVFPESAEERRAQSPVYNIARINVPLMLVHGARDERVPISQFNDFVRQLEAAGKPPQVTVVEEDEGHGFFNFDNKVELYTRMEAFLDQHIGKPGASAAAGSP